MISISSLLAYRLSLIVLETISHTATQKGYSHSNPAETKQPEERLKMKKEASPKILDHLKFGDNLHIKEKDL
jgi:hypothetical protein